MINETHFKFYYKPNIDIVKQPEILVTTENGKYKGRVLLFNMISYGVNTKYLENLTLISDEKYTTIDGLHIISIEVM
jgi:hypothetical protein